MGPDLVEIFNEGEPVDGLLPLVVVEKLLISKFICPEPLVRYYLEQHNISTSYNLASFMRVVAYLEHVKRFRSNYIVFFNLQALLSSTVLFGETWTPSEVTEERKEKLSSMLKLVSDYRNFSYEIPLIFLKLCYVQVFTNGGLSPPSDILKLTWRSLVSIPDAVRFLRHRDFGVKVTKHVTRNTFKQFRKQKIIPFFVRPESKRPPCHNQLTRESTNMSFTT